MFNPPKMSLVYIIYFICYNHTQKHKKSPYKTKKN